MVSALRVPVAAESSANESRSSGRSAWRDVLLVYAASRAFFALAGSLMLGAMPTGDFHERTQDNPLGTLSIWAHWDGTHYLTLAEGGYDAGSPTFFPLYPLLVRLAATIVGGPITAAGLSVFGVLVSLAALPLGLWFVHRIAERETGSLAVARRAVLLLAFFPTAFFFGAVYTESLFLALSAGVVWALRVRQDLFVACVLAGLATATRNVGVFLLLPIVVEWWSHRQEPGWRGRTLLLAPTGLLAYAAYLWVSRGDPFTFVRDQAAWGRDFGGLYGSIEHAVVGALSSARAFMDAANFRPFTLGRLLTTASGLEPVYNVIFLVAGLAALVLAAKRLPWHLTLYAGCLIAVAMFFGSATDALMGLPRYLVVAFPLFIAVAAALQSWRGTAIVASLSALVGAVLTAFFVNWHFVA